MTSNLLSSVQQLLISCSARRPSATRILNGPLSVQHESHTVINSDKSSSVFHGQSRLLVNCVAQCHTMGVGTLVLVDEWTVTFGTLKRGFTVPNVATLSSRSRCQSSTHHHCSMFDLLPATMRSVDSLHNQIAQVRY